MTRVQSNVSSVEAAFQQLTSIYKPYKIKKIELKARSDKMNRTLIRTL